MIKYFMLSILLVLLSGCNSNNTIPDLKVNENKIEVKEIKSETIVIPDYLLNRCIKPQNTFELIPSLNSNSVINQDELSNAYMIIYSNYTNCYLLIQEIKAYQKNISTSK